MNGEINCLERELYLRVAVFPEFVLSFLLW